MTKTPEPPRKGMVERTAQPDYSDDVTDRQLEQIRRLTEEENLSDAVVVSGPAWSTRRRPQCDS